MHFHSVTDGNLIDGYYLDYKKAKERAAELNQFIQDYKEKIPRIRTAEWFVDALETED